MVPATIELRYRKEQDILEFFKGQAVVLDAAMALDPEQKAGTGTTDPVRSLGQAFVTFASLTEAEVEIEKLSGKTTFTGVPVPVLLLP